MVKTITDIVTTIFFIAFAAFLVKNASGTKTVITAGTTGLVDTLKAVTYQK